MQFQKDVYECLQLCCEEVKNEEQTQEIRIPDAMPDIGSVLGAWGQVLIRSKEWKGDSVGITGGVMTWVLYAPEDGSMPRTVEGWIPFSIRWDIPQAERDGRILSSCLLRSVDGRCLSGRKLMVRSNVSMAVQAYVPSELPIYSPGNVPQDIQLLRKNYPVCLPAEAGEKQFQMDEDLTLPADMAGGKILSYSLQPEIVDKKLMADKAVFRGMALVRALVRSEEGKIKACSFEVPFSQYAQLDREYGDTAEIQVTPAVTSMEMDILEEGKIRLKAGLTGQYLICDRPLVEVIEDAYSNRRDVSLKRETAQIPMILDLARQNISVAQTAVFSMNEVVDVSMYLQQPTLHRGAESAQITCSGGFHVLGTNESGALMGASAKWEEGFSIPADRDTRILVSCYATGTPRAASMPEETALRADAAVEVMTLSAQGLPQVTGLELGELRDPDPQRPAIVLRRAQTGELWQLAKESGSTVEAIRRANRLLEEPLPGQMLLIPVM